MTRADPFAGIRRAGRDGVGRQGPGLRWTAIPVIAAAAWAVAPVLVSSR